ncbi:maleylpyruvate isomerase family mycothiol-dependent enzyme [Streptomyces actinomycinicus]|uniref:Maleylpyruvate isomerase family mycothiol-dependent enzyme n=1 Tax=Streptomyces actinomycinicus TaxID=1695166 RepID=A0A937EH63_9ACTN|nr:maleylpyruvate isomerase family mycothiol-dependent enzyme [Streptomyces actinomycinicus]MBL1082448.1 maleylpyruvate isomerase family mycothiol-dependent enzyme [Streptomyces actinomycinicus]
MTTTSRAGHPLPYDTYREAVEQETRRFAEVVKGADPASTVPSCPDWTLADLTRHVGSLQRWFCALLTQRVQEPPRSRDVDLGLPEHAQDYADWLVAGIPAVAAVLRDTDPGAPMWVWGEDRHARFWARRMLFETLVHRVDAERAVGRASDLDPALAADGVDEFLVNLPYAGLFAPGVTKLRGGGETVAFRCTDVAGAAGEEWRVRLEPDGLRVLPPTGGDAESGPPTAAVQGPAADLLLLLYGRRSRHEAPFDSSGDDSVLDRWFTHTAF